jgi:hypothetical protein
MGRIGSAVRHGDDATKPAPAIATTAVGAMTVNGHSVL